MWLGSTWLNFTHWTTNKPAGIYTLHLLQLTKTKAGKRTNLLALANTLRSRSVALNCKVTL